MADKWRLFPTYILASPEMILKCWGSKLRAGGEVEYDVLEIDRVVENVLGCPWKLVSS